MHDLVRFAFLLLIALLVLLSVVQCRSVLTEAIDRPKRSVINGDFINLCRFRKSRLCDDLRGMSNTKSEQPEDDQELWKRGVSQFYSNW